MSQVENWDIMALSSACMKRELFDATVLAAFEC